jgi:hypothetical protein
VEALGPEIYSSSLCNNVLWLWWLVHLHPQRSRVQCLPWTKQHTKQDFWVSGHKWDISEVREDLQVTSIKSSAYLLCHANENVPHRSSEGCSAGLDFQSTFLDDNDKIVSVPLCPIHSKNAQFAIYMCEDSGHYAGYTQHSCQTCLMPERTYLQIAWDCGQRMPTLGQCSRACKLRTANQVFFYT